MKLGTVGPGTIVDGRYELLKHLGDGGMGSVFLALEPELDRTIAIKLLHTTLVGDPESRVRFAREGKVLSQLSHPNLLFIYRLGIWEDTPYIAMEYLEGRTLSDIIVEQGPMTFEQMRAIVGQICEGMHAAHLQGIVHRDLKPTNVVVTPDGTVKVLDFGLARILSLGSTGQNLTLTGQVVGSIYYLSPEQCMGRQADARSDIYATGCLIHECVSGTPPFSSDSPVAVIHKHVSEPYHPLSKSLNTPAGLDEILFKALAKDAGDRYQSMIELKVDLEMVSGGATISRGFIAPPPRRKATRPLLLASVLAAVAITATLFFSTSNNAPKGWEAPEHDHPLEGRVKEAERFGELFRTATTNNQKQRYALFLDRRVHGLAVTGDTSTEQRSRVERLLKLEAAESWKYLTNGLSERVYFWMDLADLHRQDYKLAKGKNEELLAKIRCYLDQSLAAWQFSLSPSAGLNLRLKRCLVQVECRNLTEALNELDAALPLARSMDEEYAGVAVRSANALKARPHHVDKLIGFANDLLLSAKSANFTKFEDQALMCDIMLSMAEFCKTSNGAPADIDFFVSHAQTWSNLLSANTVNQSAQEKLRKEQIAQLKNHSASLLK